MKQRMSSWQLCSHDQDRTKQSYNLQNMLNLKSNQDTLLLDTVVFYDLHHNIAVVQMMANTTDLSLINSYKLSVTICVCTFLIQ